MKTVLHVILSLEIGGMEQVASTLVLNLDPRRFRSVVVCLQKLGPLEEVLRNAGITVILLDTMIPVVSFLFPYELIKVVREYDVDVVHVHSGCWHKAAMAGFLAGVPNIIYTEHGRRVPDLKKTIILDRIYSVITRHVICVSRELANYMARVVGVSRGKISCVINGIDETKFVAARTPQPEHGGRLGIVARLSPEKDLVTLLQAIRLVHERGVAVKLSVAGDGDERHRLELLTASLGLSGVVTYLGFQRDIQAMLKEIDIFCLTSLSEGTSISILEAMAAGKPVVATRVGGTPSIIADGVNGLLVPPQDPPAFADALMRLMSDRALRERMSSATLRAVQERFSLSVMTQAYEACYERETGHGLASDTSNTVVTGIHS